MQQLLYDQLCFEDDIQEAMKEDKDQKDDSPHDRDSGTDTDTEMPILVGRVRHDVSSNDDTSDGSYVVGEYEQQSGYHTDNDNSSIDDSADESNNTIPGLQEQNRDDTSSDEDSVYHHNHECD